MTNSCKNSKTYLRGNSIFWFNILHQQIFLKSMSYIKIYLASITCNTQAPISSSRASKPPTWRGEREASFCISLDSKPHIIIWKILEWLLILGYYALCCQNMSTLIEFQYPPLFSRPSCLLLSIIAFVIFLYLYLYLFGICIWLLHPLYFMSQSSSTPSSGKTATPLSILATPCLGDTSYWWVQKYLEIFSMKIWEFFGGISLNFEVWNLFTRQPQ